MPRRPPTDPSRWQLAREIFDSVANLAAGERSARLDDLCGGDAELRREVESLLAHDQAGPDTIGQVVGDAARELAAPAAGLKPGQTLLHYDLNWKVGQGGMGEVWKAVDRTLGREVAIKVLPGAVAADQARLARFGREAKLLAALNHPNIAAVYSLHQEAPVPFLAMEFVEGDDLSQRLARGALPLAEALPIARQIAEALEEAHEKGIVHRDLKPANVKLKPDGKIKVLDFGLAKALAGDTPLEATSDPAELSGRADERTRAGVILGTAAYMPPEQARGLPVDKRADIWAFGVILFEMLSGRRPFAGETLTDVLASVVGAEPDWSQIPPGTPRSLVRLIVRCLHKDVRQRLRDIGDARIEIEQLIAEHADSSASAARIALIEPRGRPWRRDAAVFVLGVSAAAVAVWLLTRPPAVEPVVQRLNLALPASLALEDVMEATRQSLAVSRDGRTVVFVARGPGARRQIYRRRVDGLTAEPIAGTEGGDMPFLSPDGAWVGFAATGQLKKVPIGGGQALVICDAPEPRGASWAEDDTIVFAATVRGGLSRVPASGGSPVSLTNPEVNESDGGHRWPHVLPGARGVLFNIEAPARLNRTVNVLDLETGQHQALARGTDARYVDGYVVFGRAGTLVALPFDLARLAASGPEVTVLDDVRMDERATGRMFADIAASGALVFVPGYLRAAERSLVWLDREGRSTPVTPEKRAFVAAQLSPDGQRVAVVIQDSGRSLWVHDLRRATWTRLTTIEGRQVTTPAWTPDGERVLFSWNPSGLTGLHGVAADGREPPEELLARDSWLIDMPSVAPGGAGAALIAVQDPNGDDIYRLSLDGRRRVEPFVVTRANEASPSFSPSGRYVAYTSTESGRREVYIRPYDGSGPKWIVSTGGGSTPRWRSDEQELYYLEGPRLMAVPIDMRAGDPIGTPRLLFEESALAWTGLDLSRYDVTADGQRFITVKPDAWEVEPLQIVMAPRFGDELTARVRAAAPR